MAFDRVLQFAKAESCSRLERRRRVGAVGGQEGKARIDNLYTDYR